MNSASARGIARRVLVLDFDGTVSLGDDPVRLYADEVATRVGEPHATSIRVGIEAFLGESGDIHLPGIEDGYQAVVALAEPSGIDKSAADAAYVASRRRLDAGEGEIHPPDGLVALLDEVRGLGVRVVLVTNSPLIGIEWWLESVDLADRFDQLVPDAGKPGRMGEILATLLADARATNCPDLLLSVGDVWANDIAPALELGCRGLYVDRFDTGRGPAEGRARTFAELYEIVRQWASEDSSIDECSPNRNL